MVIFFFLFTIIGAIKVLKTPMLHFFPQIKMHHVVVLANNHSLFFVDFTPINQSSFLTLRKLLLGYSVKAEIRIVETTNTSLYNIENDELLFEEWEKIREKPRDSSIQIPFLEDWNNETMNLYNHNCQHFSAFVLRKNLTSFIIS